MATAQQIKEAYPNAAPIARDIVDLANKLEMPSAGWLANLMNFETGGTFSPSIRNRHSGATGLIQFMPSTARGMGTTTDELAQMSAKQQMKYVEKYLMRKKKNSKSFSQPTDVYMAVFFPVAMGKGGDFDIYEWYIQNRGQSAADTYLRQNGGIRTAQDYTDHANRNAKLPTGWTGIQIGNTGIRVLPVMAGVSVGLLAFALYVRFAEPEWATFMRKEL